MMFGTPDHKAVDTAITTLGKLLQEEIAPVVMVLSTPLVEDSCIKNGLSLVQILTPFCFFDNIDVPVRTASDQPYRLQKFNLRLLYGSSIRHTDFEVSKGHIGQVIRSAGENIVDLFSEPPNIGDLMVAPQSEILPSWFEGFNKELIRIPCFSDHEAFDHPVACLLVISSKDEQPINRFVDLFNTNQLPSLLNDGVMDPKILKHYLLVHDNQNGLPDEAENILSEMKSTFGSNDCHLLCINSSEASSEEHLDNPWIGYNISSLPNPHIGRYLDADDENMLKELMHDLSSKHIIPHMEQKIRLLNQQVSMTRKGFRNQIKNLWWRKGKEETEDAPNGPLYTFSSIESQIRVLGDYAFMLHDYELALTNYRLLSTDYKLDKAWKRYAGVQEMMGLAYFMLDASRKEAEYCMENAFNIYVKIRSSGWRNAVRCGLWWAEMLKTWDQFSDAAAVFSRISGEEPLHSAVLLEQASYCYLFSKPPMLRKHGFHLVLSGDLYKRCDQINHAIRTYRSALSVYKDTTWKPVNDHVRFYIGKWYAVLGNFDVAIRLMLRVMECSHQSCSNQGLFLLDFIGIVERVGKEFKVPGLQLPIINMKSLKVMHEDHRTYASSAAVSVSENVWKSLETDMIPSIPASKTNWLESQSNMPSQNNKKLNICVVGEPVKVAVEFRNPLQISLSISNVALVCELSRRPDECASEANSMSQNKEEINHSKGSSDPMSHSTLFTLSNAEFSLEGGETYVAYLEVTPLAEGVLKITGIRWQLSSLVGGFHNFIKPGTETTHKRRIKPRSTIHDFLDFTVIGNLPRLEVSIQRFPKKVHIGALHHLHLELKNESECHVKNLKINVSHPRVMRVGTCENLNAEFPEFIENRADYEHGCGQGSFSEFSSSVFTFPEVKLIRGERPLLWPIWLRATSAGPLSLYLTLYYEMEDTSKAIRFRCLRMYYSLEVLPSLNMDFKFSRSPSKLDELLVRMDVKNDTGSERFLIHQLLMASRHWKMYPIQPLDVVLPSCGLPPGRAFSFFFNLKNEMNEGDDSASSQPQVRNMSFSCSGQDTPQFDLCNSPFADFHSSERFYQNQENSHAVDFVMISRLLRQKNDPDSLPLFLSHHTCGCSFEDTGPIWWVMKGPRVVSHDFSISLCEVPLKILLHNTTDATATIEVTAAEDICEDIKPTSNSLEKGAADSRRVKPGPWMWSGPVNRKIKLEPYRQIESPLQISVFAPGVYDLSQYIVKWIIPGAKSRSSKGLPFFLSVTQKHPC